MSAEKKLIVIGGPTGSGKTTLAIALARYFSAQIISADSRQFYSEMAIGTARPTSAELAAAKHHFVGHLSITQPYSVGDFERDTLALLEKLYAQSDWAILVGGSSLYLKAVCEGLDDFPSVPPAIRDAVEADFVKSGLSALLKELQQGDPAYYDKVDRANPARIKRAVSFLRAHRRPFSSFQTGDKAKRPFQCIYLTPYFDRAALYSRIDQRVRQMMTAGLLEEAQQLIQHQALNALQTVGYKELIAHLNGEMALESAVQLIQQNSRRYAKRQLTWMRKEAHWRRIKAGEAAMAINFVELIQKGWRWNRDQQNKESFGLEKASLSIRLLWQKVHKKNLGLLSVSGDGLEQLLPHFLDQAEAIAEEQDYCIVAAPAMTPALQSLGWLPKPMEDWIKIALPEMDLALHSVWYPKASTQI